MNSISRTPSSGLLNIGKSAVAAQQQMLNTTSNNIANVGTEGYVRQRSQTYTSTLNYGVGDTLTQRLNDVYSQQEVWRDTSTSAFYNTKYDQLYQIDQYLSSSSTGMGSSILGTFTALQSAVNDPSSIAQRSEFLGSMKDLTNRFGTLSADIGTTQRHNSEKIGEDIGTVNDLLKNIADLNKALQATHGDRSSTTYNLMDQRDEAIHQLSQYMDIRTYPQENDVMLVTLSTGHTLVLEDGHYAVFSEVEGNPDSENTQLFLNFNGLEHPGTRLNNESIGGEIGALLSVRTEIEEAQKSLGQLAIAMADALNNQNHNGINLNGELGGDLFEISPVVTLGSNNTSSVTTTVNLGMGSSVTTNDFYIEFTSDTGNFTIYTIEKNGAEPQEIGTGNTAAGNIVLDDYGLTFEFSGTNKKGDSFFIQPTLNAASTIKTALVKEEDVAFASAFRVTDDSQNFGKGTAIISNISNIDSIDISTMTLKAGTPASIMVNNDSNYEILDSDGNTIATADASCEGKNILAAAGLDFGFDITVSGKVYAGDSFKIEINTDAPGDNSNGLKMCALQTDGMVIKGTNSKIKQNFTERYASITSEFGTVVSSAKDNATAAEAKLNQSLSAYENTTGVSLDEEAANLVKFQQYYQAAARIISASQTVFDALISAV